jgi:hypothetical protein
LDPRETDSDGDGLNDTEEVVLTRTDPEEEVTYNLTYDHEELIETDGFSQDATLIMPNASYETLTEQGLTDETDDFDFVTVDNESGYGSVTFTAMDGKNRTDVWVNNTREIEAGTDPWDPDTDDDGLTDGWELSGITWNYRLGNSAQLLYNESFSSTSPTSADTDADGYWDGWIAVYNANYTDNVVLYREYLQSGDGIEGDEIVSAQAGYHEKTEAPVPFHSGVDIDDDGTEEHSNIHMGERHWDTVDDSIDADPADWESTPDPQLDVEVDYDDDVDQTMLDAVRSADDHFQLYDFKVNYHIDDELTHSDLSSSGITDWDDEHSPTTRDDADEIEERYHDNTSDRVYLYLSTTGGNGLGVPNWTEQDGVASTDGNGVPTMDYGMVVFNHSDTSNDTEREQELQKTVMHETGHIIGAGRNDDSFVRSSSGTEIYSERSKDNTNESVNMVASGYMYDSVKWSMMASGWHTAMKNNPYDENVWYPKFSIEELLTVEFNRPVKETHELISNTHL